MVNSKIVAIIPARGGSKRIPNKNIIDFYGKPMIAWTIKAAINSNLFDKIIVSTDSEDIASISKKYGAEVPFLRKKFNDDYTPVSMATLFTLNEIEKKLNKKYEVVIQLFPNCPLRESKHIVEAYNKFLETKVSFLISCFRYGWMNPWWAYKLDKKFSPIALFNEATEKRSQDLPPLYCPTGAIWIAKISELKHTKTFYGSNLVFSFLDWKFAIDIDNFDDLDMAKCLFALNNKLNKIKI